MKVKELKRTVNVAWSPAELHPACLAAGSAAQQVDASFSSSSSLDLYGLNFEDPGQDLELKSSLQTQHKFQKLVWSAAGIIVGGCDGGLLEFYSADRLLKKSSDALMGSSTKHNGHISALDINPYQKNLLASGASESEIFIWDLNNTAQPMAPGNRSQPLDHVQGVAWNHQVQHILGSTFATRCVVWDLRKNEPIMKLSDSQSRTRWRALAWHPSVATQLCIASEDDTTPVIQLWDLRLAASPLVTLEGHRKGVMALSWCTQDPDLLLSAGKDGRVLCWNPNNTQPGGELLMEVCEQQQWVFDVAWCPRNPGVLVSSSFEQQTSVHCLLGGTTPETTSHTQSNIMDSFGGADSFNQLPAVQRAPAPAQPTIRPQLPRPPKWLKRPVGAKFAFGGKLVSFEKCPQEAGTQKLVHISQVVSEPEIVERATELDTVLGSSLSQDPSATERLAEYCRQRGDEATDQNERYTWYFLRANFMPTFRTEVLSLLGFKQDEAPKLKNSTGDGATSDALLSRGESTETEAELSTDTSTDDAQTLIERKLANVDLGPAVSNVAIPNGEDTLSAICRALVCGQLEEAVELCLGAKRIADALIIASLGSQELLYKVQKYHLNQSASDPVSLIAGSLLLSKWDSLVLSASSNSWKDTLAALVTHTDGNALQHYCEMLGDKLSKESDPSLNEAATICYLCGMSPDALVARWARRGDGKGRGRDAQSLARLTELALLARRAALARGRQLQSLGKLEAVLTEYASRLAAQGCLHSALNTLEGVERTELRERLKAALGMVQTSRRASHQPTAQQPQPQYNAVGARSRTVSGHSQKRGHLVAHNDVSHTYSAVPAYDATPQPPQPPQLAHTNTIPWGNTSVPAAPPPAPPAPHPAQPIQPARPGSTGPTAGGITSRSKYKVDPSVQAAPSYNQYNFNQAQSSYNHNQSGYNSTQSGYNSTQSGYNPPVPVGGYNSPLPDQYGGATQTFNPLHPAASTPSYNAPINPTALNPSTMAASTNGGYYGGAPPAQPPPASSKPVPPGWNDPPVPAGKPKPKQEVQAQAPITHPLFGVEPPPQHIPLNPAQQYPGQQYPGQQQYPDQQYGQQYPAQQYPGQQNYAGNYAPAYPAQLKQEVQAQAPITHPLFGVEPPPQHIPLNPVQQYPGQQQYPDQQYGQQYPAQQYPGQQNYAGSYAPVYPAQLKQEVQAQAPITHPLFGVEPPPPHNPLNPVQPYLGQQDPVQQYPGQQQYPDQQYGQQYPAQQYPGQQNYAPVYPAQVESPLPAAVAEPAAPVQKAPIPEHHVILQTVLDSLRADCVARAANPQMKRKLEDVHKRLETLYDMLREYRLSESALSALHTCVQYAQSGDYEQAGQTATSLAGGADFAAAASFLPGLKVLFQLAQQLQVYAR